MKKEKSNNENAQGDLMNKFKERLKQNQGMGMIEVIIIILILLAIAVIFREQIKGIVVEILAKVKTDLLGF